MQNIIFKNETSYYSHLFTNLQIICKEKWISLYGSQKQQKTLGTLKWKNKKSAKINKECLYVCLKRVASLSGLSIDSVVCIRMTKSSHQLLISFFRLHISSKTDAFYFFKLFSYSYSTLPEAAFLQVFFLCHTHRHNSLKFPPAGPSFINKHHIHYQFAQLEEKTFLFQ